MKHFLIILLLIPVFAWSQSKVHFTLLNQEHGLRGGDVMCFEQDQNGFVWIGTKYGLNVYDGKHFNVYQFNADVVPFVSDISYLKRLGNEIWIGTFGDGLFIYDIKKKTLNSIALILNKKPINHINCISYWNQHLWIGTNAGMFKIDPDYSVSLVDFTNDELSILSIADFDNYLAVGTQNNGLYIIDKQINVDTNILKTAQINTISLINGKEMLIGTQASGLASVKFNKKDFELINYSSAFEGSQPVINKILIDRNKKIWVGTDGEGLFKFTLDDAELQFVDNYKHSDDLRNSIVSNAIFSLFEDNEGKIWIGTIWKGLNILNQNSTNATFYYSDLYGKAAYPVLSINKINNELWFGTDGKGLSVINTEDKSIKTYNNDTKPSIEGDYIQTIFNDSKGKVWLGTFSSGLIAFDKEKGTEKVYKNKKDDPSSISFNDVRTILEAENGDLWIATWGGGLNRYNRSSDSFESFQFTEKGMVSHLTDNITSLCFSADKKGIWIGTFGNGIFYFDIFNKSFNRIPTKTFQSLKVLSLYLDKKVLWVGTWGKGMYALNTVSLSNVKYSGIDLIGSSRVTSIVKDDFENIWLSSKDGIYRFNTLENTLLKYGGFNLVTNKEFHINSVFKDKEGIIYFGGIEGVVAITPMVNLEIPSLSSPTITRLNLYNDTTQFGFLNSTNAENSIQLNHKQNYFTISYSSPNFNISDVNYSYRMQNLKEDWILTTDNQTTFTNIPAGDYVFYVRASLNNYQWSVASKIYLSISQPIWKRWYAYAFYLIVFTLLLFLFQKYSREREALKANLKVESLTREKERELHNIKHRFFTNISHEIRTPVTLILGVANRLTELGQIPKSNHKEVEVMRKSSLHLLNLINELLDFRRLEKDGIQLKVAEGNFAKYIYEIFLSFQLQANTNNIDYQFISVKDDLLLWYDRDQMEKVVYNLLSNAFKYTPLGGSIIVEVDHDDQHVFLKVQDSGKGMKEEQISEIFKRFYQSDNAAELRKSGFGLGLSIAKDIVLLHSGEIDAQNNQNKGLSISIKLPLGNNHFNLEQRISNFKDSEHVDSYTPTNEPIAASVSLSEYSDSTLLIVEDNENILSYVKGLFTDIKTIYTAINGEEGFQIATDKIPDIIVSDVMMPILDGVSMTKQLKINIKTSHIPIVLLTARTNLIYKKEGFEVGADEYITKPFNETLLRTRVYNLLKSRKQLSEKLLKEYISKPQEELSLNTPDQKFLADLTRIIEMNIHENVINAKLISSELCMSHSVIYKKIKALTGLSMIEFIRDFRLNRAAILLSKYQMSVTDVCYKVGFTDRRYFSKVFKAKFNVSPSEYAKTSGVN